MNVFNDFHLMIEIRLDPPDWTLADSQSRFLDFDDPVKH